MAIIDKKPVIRLILKVILAHTCVKIKVNDIVLYLVFVLFLKRKKMGVKRKLYRKATPMSVYMLDIHL